MFDLNQSFQSHTCFRKWAILTFFPFISTIHGCSSIRHGVARRGGSFSRLRHLVFGIIEKRKKGWDVPAFDEVFEILTPSDPTICLIS